MLDVRFPAGPPVTVDHLIDEVMAGSPLSVGDERVRDFLVAVGRRLARPALARRRPELGALGFFLRPDELLRTIDALRGDHVRMPRGLAFHLPPAEVETVFVYAWALSALMGNRNVVRLSPRAGPVAATVVGTLQEALDGADPVVAATQRIICYDRSPFITAALSSACDLRVSWGGDRAAHQVRRHPLAPHARELTFPDRSSFAVVRAPAWLEAPQATRTAVAEGLVNDSYWFDQAACSSPRAVFWVGPREGCDAARADFAACLARAVKRRGWAVDAAAAVRARVAACADAFPPAAGVAAPRRWLGTGTFTHARLGSLAELVPLVGRRDQTMTHFGFAREELMELAHVLAGRGVERMVPFGEALSFHRVWDGRGVAAEFTRLVTVFA